MIGRREFLARGCLAGAFGLAAVAAGGFPLMAKAQREGGQKVDPATALRDRAASKGLFYGAAGVSRILAGDAGFAAHFAQECGILVPDWELKWKALRPGPTAFDFAHFDWLLGFARGHDMLFRGHNLVWHEDLPPWFSGTVNAANAEGFLLRHIENVVGRHAGKVHSWDVVNEPIALWDRHPDGLRTSSPWHRLLGPRYMDLAFHAAAKADPQAMLVLNQNRIEQERPGDDGTRAATLKLLRRMKSAGTPIHALGVESHLGQDDAQFNAKKFQQFLGDVADLGLKIIITELDMEDRGLPAGIAERDRILARRYYDYLSVALDQKAVIGVLTWGLSDKYSWLTKYAPRKDGLAVRPLPLDERFARKPVWEAIARAFDEAPTR